MNRIKLIFVISLWVFLYACNSQVIHPTPIITAFPLEHHTIYESQSEIFHLATSNEWIALYESGKIIALEIASKKTLWKLNTILTTSARGFRIVDDSLITTYNNQVMIVTKTGNKRLFDIHPKNDSYIITVEAIYDDYIYIVQGPNWTINAYKISTGEFFWSLPFTGSSADLFYDEQNNIVYFIDHELNILYSVENNTGNLLWDTNQESLRAAFEKKSLFFLDYSSTLKKYTVSRFDINTREEKWSYRNDNDIVNLNAITALENTIIVGGGNGIIALDKFTGAELWKTSLNDPILGNPVEFNGYIFLTDYANAVIAISQVLGEPAGFILYNDDTDKENGDELSGYIPSNRLYRINIGLLLKTKYSVIGFFESR